MVMNYLEKTYLVFRDLFSKPQERGESSAGYWQDKIRSNVITITSQYKGKILEVGCGEGLFLSQLLRANPHADVYGVDTINFSLGKAKERLKKENLQASRLINAVAVALPFKNASFNAVMCVNVFICVSSLNGVKAIIQEIGRVCQGQGRVVIEFRNRRNPFLWLKYRLAKYYDHTIVEQKHPLSIFFREDILNMLQDAGFHIVKEKSIDSFMIKFLAPIFIIEAQKT